MFLGMLLGILGKMLLGILGKTSLLTPHLTNWYCSQKNNKKKKIPADGNVGAL